MNADFLDSIRKRKSKKKDKKSLEDSKDIAKKQSCDSNKIDGGSSDEESIS